MTRDDFPTWLSARLAQLDMTQADLARALSVHEATVSRWLSGTRRPSDGLIPKMAGALHVETAEVHAAMGRFDPDDELSPLEADILYEVRALPASLQATVLDIARRLREYWEEQTG